MDYVEHDGDNFASIELDKMRSLRKPKGLVVKIGTVAEKRQIKINKKQTIQIQITKKSKGNEGYKHQNNIKEILVNTNATPIRCKGGIGYACCFCTNQYPEPADLKAHTSEMHVVELPDFMQGKDMHGYLVKLDITNLRCNICGESLDDVEIIMNHLKDSHNKIMYFDIKSHILPFKFDNDALRCFMCWNIFNTFKALQEHMNVHYRNYICSECGAGFVNKNTLLRHKDAHKTGTFTCEKCSRVFDTARKKKLHDRSKHNDDILPHKCGYCAERFKEVWKKNEHLSKVHGIRKPAIKCQACDKKFDTKNQWRLHTSRVHLMQRPHKCTHCEMDFYAKKELEIHMVKHTGTREFKCEFCLKSYGRQKTLKEHIRRVHSSCTHPKINLVKVQRRKRGVISLTPSTTPSIQVVAKKIRELDKHQHNIKIILRNSNATPILCRNGFRCCYCTEKFREAGDLKRHTLETHDDKDKSNFMEGASILSYVVRLDITDLHCGVCQTNIKELEDLIEHLRTVHGKMYHMDVDNYIVPFRFDSEDLQCVICSKEFNHLKGLAEHMNVHYKNHICGVCGAGFVNKKNLRAHGYRHELGEFKCSSCPKVFSTKINRSDHERTVHVDEKRRNKCWFCGEKFASYPKKQDHEINVHGAKRLILNCKACDRTFGSQRALTAHTKTFHLIARRVVRKKDHN